MLPKKDIATYLAMIVVGLCMYFSLQYLRANYGGVERFVGYLLVLVLGFLIVDVVARIAERILKPTARSGAERSIKPSDNE